MNYRSRVNDQLLLIASVMLTACATVADLKANLDNKKPCCANLAELTFEDLSATEVTDFELNESSPVFEFDVGKSYFKAYALPAEAKGKTLRVMASPTGNTGFETAKLAQVYCPRMLFLNEQKQLVEASEEMPNFIRGGWGGGDHGFTADATIPPGAKYVVLHANPARFGIQRYLTYGSSVSMVGMTPVVSPGGSLSYPCAPVARAKARIK